METLTSILQCPICLQQFNLTSHIPKILTCGHNVCSLSLNNLFVDKHVKCPQCRQDNMYDTIDKVATNFGLQSMLKAFQGKNFIMIGSQPIFDQLQKTEEIIKAITSENEEIEYFFDDQIQKMQKEKNKTLQFNKDIITLLQAYKTAKDDLLQPQPIQIEIDNISQNEQIKENRKKLNRIKNEIIIIQKSYLKVVEVQQNYKIINTCEKITQEKINQFKGIENYQLFKDYTTLYNNILNSIDTHSTIWRNYQFTENSNLMEILSILERQSSKEFPEVMVVYGFLLKLGLGVKKNEKAADELFQQAAKGKNPRGNYLAYITTNELKYLYAAVRGNYHNAFSLLGIDVDDQDYEDDELRYVFFQAAAEKGSPAGKSNFAAFILKDKQYDKSAFWYQSAIEDGYHQKSKKKLDKIYKKTTNFKKKFPNYKKWTGDYTEFEYPKTYLL